MATQFVGDEGDNTLEGGAGENEFTGNAGNDVINATEGVNTIYYNQGDGIDTVNFPCRATTSMQTSCRRQPTR